MLIRTYKLSFYGKASFVYFKSFSEVNVLEDEKKKGDFTIQQRKKKREIIEENHHQVDLPPDVSDEEKKALEQTGEDATSGW
jgi:hypothetical protein